MEIIHANANLVDLAQVRTLKQFDAVASLVDKSNYYLALPGHEWQRLQIETGHVIYIPDSEWGGYVNRIKIVGDQVDIYGDLWRQRLNKNLLKPPSGQAYLTMTGAPETVIPALLGNHFGSLYSVVAGDIASMSVEARYSEIGRTIERSLRVAGGRLDITIGTAGQINLKAAEITDWSDAYEINEDYGVIFTFDVDLSGAINHVIALGSGELENRRVIEAWLLPNGEITYNASHPNRPTGVNETTYKLDYPNAEDDKQLQDGIVKAFTEAKNGIKTEINLSAAQLFDLEIGDLIASRNRLTGLYAKQTITEKILRVSAEGIPTVRYTSKE
ncbi:MAG: hypothetical protein GX900_06545 [Clostridiaceae bacterium]|jgi:hypothetical protein|nr:hypothetical protein [Clostridiaceae bacterium]